MTKTLTDLQNAVVKHQTEGDDWIVGEILRKVTQPFMENPTRLRYASATKRGGQIYIQLESNMDYIAYTIRAKKELAIRQFTGEFNDYDSHEFCRLLSVALIDCGVDIGIEPYKHSRWNVYYKINDELIAAVRKKLPELKRKMYERDYKALHDCYEYYRIKFDKDREQREQGIKGLELNIVEALCHALRYVDPSRSDREIVSYINRAWTTKFGGLELKRNGLKRIERQNNFGDIATMYVKHHFPEDLRRVLFDGIKYKPENCTRMQNAFVGSVFTLIEKDAAASTFTGYSCNKRGEARIKHSYIAEKTGEKATTVRKRMERIKERCHTS